MRDHQRFFYVTDHAGKLLPHFVSVRNGNAEYLDNVVAGNEKVLTARLEDAKFFYEEDQETTIADYVEQLKKVSFHDKIGTIYEKMQRVDNLAQQIGQQVGLTADELAHLHRAAQIYKFDLVTGMVGEFAELQGTMGEIYARLQVRTRLSRWPCVKNTCQPVRTAHCRNQRLERSWPLLISSTVFRPSLRRGCFRAVRMTRMLSGARPWELSGLSRTRGGTLGQLPGRVC